MTHPGHGPIGAWYGKAPELWNYAATTSGLSIITDIGEKVFDKYLVFGNNNGSGTSSDYAPEGAPEDFERMSREWYVNSGGTFNTELYFNLQEASGGGNQIPIGGSDSSYVLMSRSTNTDQFMAIAYPDNFIGQILVFEGVPLDDKYYTIGYASETIPIEPDGLVEQRLQQITVGPNPANDKLTIQYGAGTEASIFSLTGQLLMSFTLNSNQETLDINSLQPGMYLLRYKFENSSLTRKLVINR